MSWRLQSRITASHILAATLFLCLSTHGSVFDRSQRVQVGRTLQNRSKLKGDQEDRGNLETTELQSDGASSANQGRWAPQAAHLVVDETEKIKRYTSLLVIRQSNESYTLTPGQDGADGKERFQSDSPGFNSQGVQGKMQLSSARVTEDWFQMRPQVQCSPAAIILTAKGWNYVHFLVDRVGGSPVSLLHLPSQCGYIVRATWRDLVLVAPYDGCYVLQQNGRYVLPLLWWGMPVSISCPMTPAAASATPSGFCSNLGITLRIEGSRKSVEKYSIKVNEEWVPLVSDTCAYHMDSANEDLVLFIPFTGQCAKDGGSTLDVLLDEKMYTLFCQPQYNPSAPSSQIIPVDPTLTEPEINMQQPQHHIVISSEQPTQDGATVYPQHPSLQSSDISHLPVEHSTEIPRPTSTGIITLPLHLIIPMGHPTYHFSHPTYPYYHQFYNQKPIPPDSRIPNYTALNKPPKPQLGPRPQMLQPTLVPQKPKPPQLPQVPQLHQAPQVPQKPKPLQLPQFPQLPQAPQVPQKPKPPQLPQVPQLHQAPQVPQKPKPLQLPQFPQLPQAPQVPQKPKPLQLPQFPQVPQAPQVPQKPKPLHLPQVHQVLQPTQVPQGHRFPVQANDSPQLSPVLTCKGDHLKASLHSAKIKSIKVKDVKRKVWVPVSNTPANCGYSLQHKGRSVEFFSPLPACHSYTAPPSLLSLSIKFWDTAIRKHRALKLQCPSTSPSPTITNLSTKAASLLPKPIFTRSQPSRRKGQPFHPQTKLGLYSNSSQLKGSPLQSQNPTVPLLNLPKPTVSSFQHSKEAKAAFWSSKLTRRTPPRASQMLQPEVLCHSKDMGVTLPPVPITGLTVDSPSVGIKGTIKGMLLDDAPSHCGYLMKKNQNGGINLLLPYTSCHMVYKDGQYRIVLTYSIAGGRRIEASLSCQVPVNHECNLPLEQRLACGSRLASSAECRDLGCCYSLATQTCYYPMDECTADRHFVFSIPASLTEPPLTPALLAAAGNSSCTSQRVVADMALFKIPLDGCGVHKYEVGNTVIYMVEILNTLQSVTLNYGTITRDSPFRLLVECRYLPGTVASVGYLVKSPSLGPSIQAQGVFGVQLRIAKDQQYSSYYPQYHRPLRTLVGKPLYLEVRLLNPVDPSAVLLVHYCVAYPRSAHSAWVLIYDGCPNPLDVTPSHAPPPTPSEGLASHMRRFTVSTFQFLEESRKEMTSGEEEEEVEEEEVYFMCATEVCLPSEGPCVEGCIDHSPAVKS